MSRRQLEAIAVLVLAAAAVVFLLWSKVLLIRGEEVRIPTAGGSLGATLALPRWGAGPHPAAVVVHGSGPERRGDLRGYGGQLVPAGLAVLMYDKRGVGESTGTYWRFRVADCEENFLLLAGDVVAAVEYLRGRADIDPDRIGLIGGSQAGWVMPLAAARSDGVAFLVSLSGPAVSCGQIDLYQRLTGVSGGGPAGAAATTVPNGGIDREVLAFAGPHGFDPVPILKSLEIPSLWILGGRDRHVPVALTAAVLERIAETKPNYTVTLYPEGDHDLHHAATGRLIDPGPDIRAWLRKNGFAPD